MEKPRNLLYLAGAALALMSAAPATAATAQTSATLKITGAKSETLTSSQLAAAQKTITQGTVSADKKTLTFKDKIIRLVVTTGPEDDMLSYRIAGLRNPTLAVPTGALLKILFVNTDEDMKHDLRFTEQKAPFLRHVPLAGTVGSHRLAHRSEAGFRGEEIAIRVPGRKGAYSYICTVTGHAKGGMYGRLVVR